MGAFANLSDVIYKGTGGLGAGTRQELNYFKDFRVGAAAAGALVGGWPTSLWQYDGQPSHGAAPGGSVLIPTNDTVGGWRQADPSGGRQLWLNYLCAHQTQGSGSLLLYDRLLSISGFSATVTTAQTVGGSIGRYTGSESIGNEIWVEIYTIIGVTATTITASYTNQDGTAGRTTQAAVFGATNGREAQRMIRLPLQSGDNGVRAVASVTVLATTGTAGDFGVNIVHPLISLPEPTPCVGAMANLLDKPIEIKTDACLAWQFTPTAVVLPQFRAFGFFVES